jgi:hypothetical protein
MCFGRRRAQTLFDPVGHVALAVTNEASDERIARPRASDAVAFNRSGGKTENLRDFFLVEQGFQRSAPAHLAERPNTQPNLPATSCRICHQVSGKILKSLKFALRLMSLSLAARLIASFYTNGLKE